MENEANLFLYYQNTRGLNSKLSSFYNSMAVGEYDIVALTETWLHPGVYDSEFSTQNYTIIRKDRDFLHTNKCRGGGVLIAVRSDLHYTEINLSNTPLNNFQYLDFLCIKMLIASTFL